VLSPDIARLVDPNPEPFAAAMLDLINRPEERARLSAAARVIASEKYSRDTYLRRTSLAYERLAKSRRSSGGLNGAEAGAR